MADMNDKRRKKTDRHHRNISCINSYKNLYECLSIYIYIERYKTNTYTLFLTDCIKNVNKTNKMASDRHRHVKKKIKVLFYSIKFRDD